MYPKTRTVLIPVEVAFQIVKSYVKKDPHNLTEEEIVELISDLPFFGKCFPNVFEDDIYLFDGEAPAFDEYREPVMVLERWEPPK